LQEVAGLAPCLEQRVVGVPVVEMVEMVELVRVELEGVRELPAEMQAVDRTQTQVVAVAEFFRV
jgi:hypothetical protein